MDDRKITELTVDELEALIKRNVKKCVAEVMIEFAMEADIEAQIAYEAELNEMLRSEMRAFGKFHADKQGIMPKADD